MVYFSEIPIEKHVQLKENGSMLCDLDCVVTWSKPPVFRFNALIDKIRVLRFRVSAGTTGRAGGILFKMIKMR